MPHIWPIPQIDYGSFKDIDETRAVALVTSGLAWNVVSDQLRLNVAWRVEPQSADEDYWTKLAEDLQGEVIYAVGGGLAVDTAKYLASHHDLPLICLPTALSVDAFLTGASGIRRNGAVYYIETRPPDRLLIDFNDDLPRSGG